LGIIKKVRNKITYEGMSKICNYTDANYTSPAVAKSNKDRAQEIRDQINEKKRDNGKKRQLMMEMIMQSAALRKLVQRNKECKDLNSTEVKLQLPLLILKIDKDADVEIMMDDYKRNIAIFSDKRCEFFNENHVLAKLKFHRPTFKELKSFVNPKLLEYLVKNKYISTPTSSQLQSAAGSQLASLEASPILQKQKTEETPNNDASKNKNGPLSQSALFYPSGSYGSQTMPFSMNQPGSMFGASFSQGSSFPFGASPGLNPPSGKKAMLKNLTSPFKETVEAEQDMYDSLSQQYHPLQSPIFSSYKVEPQYNYDDPLKEMPSFSSQRNLMNSFQKADQSQSNEESILSTDILDSSTTRGEHSGSLFNILGP